MEFFLILSPCKVIMTSWSFFSKKLNKSIRTLQGLRIKKNSINETYFSSKSMMQYCRTIFSDSDIFNEKNLLENHLWGKMRFLWGKLIWSSLSFIFIQLKTHCVCRQLTMHGIFFWDLQSLFRCTCSFEQY